MYVHLGVAKIFACFCCVLEHPRLMLYILIGINRHPTNQQIYSSVIWIWTCISFHAMKTDIET